MAANMNKIITKPQNRGFQLRKPVKTTAEQEKALRDQLHIEIENKSKACSNPTYDCSIPRVEGYEFCIRHILQDPRAPFKQCAYTYPGNSKKCLQPAPKYDGKKEPGLTNYCFEHSRLIQLTKTRNTVGKYKHADTNEAFLNDLAHHIKIDGGSTNFTETDEEIDVVSANADPFIHHVHSTDFDYIGKEEPPKRRLLDYASDSSSDDEVPTTSNTWRSNEWDNSDNESVDSQNEDLLKHAGIYTTEEATMITKQKMMRLQVLYMEQILRLQHLLKEKRRKYLQAIKKERETLCSIHDQPKETPQERKIYRKLKALNRYHKRFETESLLYRKYKEKRDRATEGANYKVPSFQKCIFSEGGVKCGDRVIPSCKYCKKHILEDKKQVLFRACGVEKSGVVCQEPVPNIFEDATCVLHLNLPPAKAYTQKKYESETEEDEEILDATKRSEEMKEETEEIMSTSKEKFSASTATTSPVPTVSLSNEETSVDIVEKSQATEDENELPASEMGDNMTILHQNDEMKNTTSINEECATDANTSFDTDVVMDKLELTDSSSKSEDDELMQQDIAPEQPRENVRQDTALEHLGQPMQQDIAPEQSEET